MKLVGIIWPFLVMYLFSMEELPLIVIIFIISFSLTLLCECSSRLIYLLSDEDEKL